MICSESLDAMHKSGLNHVERLTTALGDLDELGEIMTDMLSTQESVEVRFHALIWHYSL